jgi:N-acetylmuramoyl-L-alanine amidase
VAEWKLVRHLFGVIAVSLITVACAAARVETEPTTTFVPTTTTTPAPTTTITADVTTTSLLSRPPVGWIAPSGVPLAVTGVDGDIIEVLTPCGDPARLASGTPIYEVDVIIDPGHGGPVDTGAVAPTGLAEKEINLRVGLAVLRILSERGVAAMLTRSGDYPVPIPTRSEYADRVGARALVSIHHNAPAAPASDIPGVEVFIQSDSANSRRLGGLVYESTMAALGQFDIDWDRAIDAGVMTVSNSRGDDAYGMIRRPETVSVLVELGYVANRAEAEFYQRPVYPEVAATALADAIEAYLTTEDPGSGFVAGRVFNPRAGVGKDRCIEPDLQSRLYPDVVGVDVSAVGRTFSFEVTLSSPYDNADRYADAWRVIGDDGKVYGVRVLTQDHARDQPFARSWGEVEIPDTVGSVTVEARDLVYGWGGATVEVDIP